MLNFNAELSKILGKVKTNYEQQPFVPVIYPPEIDKETWDSRFDEIWIPQVEGNLYFIFDNNKELLYIGKTKSLRLSLRNHLICRTSQSTSSILNDVKEILSETEQKKLYIKVMDVRPVEMSNTIKPYLIQEYAPLLAKRLS